MASINENPNPLDNFTDEQLSDLVKSNDALDQEVARIIKEEEEEKIKSKNKPFRRLRKSPLEIINRSFLFLFLASFLFSMFSIYKDNSWLFLLYLISSFSCILYPPNRKTLKELLDAWPNLENLIKNQNLWK